MRQWILTALFIGTMLPVAAQQFGPATDTAPLQGLDEIAIVVNNESISRRQLAAEIAQERQLIPADLKIPSATLEKQLVERVIMNHLLRQLKDRLDIKVSSEEIDRAIESVAQKNNVSVAVLLQKVYKDTGLKKDAYRAQIADSIVQEKLKQGLIGRDINVSPEDINAQVAQIARQNNNAVQLQDLLLPTPKGNATERGIAMKKQMVELSEVLRRTNGDLQRVAASIPGAQLNNLGTVNLAQIPPRFARAIVTQPTGEVISEPVIDRDGMHFLKVLSRSEDGKAVIPEAKVEHILLRINAPEDIEGQKALIDDLYRRLKQGADFHQLAKQYSQDPGSAARGGELGWMGADQVVPAFSKVMLSVPLNTISQPFRTPYGWHIIRVSDRRQVDRSDDILRARIRDNLYTKYLEDAWQQRLLQLRQQAYVDIR